MRVLVTGGAGFTGKALVRRMRNEGHDVVALDNKEGHRSDELRVGCGVRARLGHRRRRRSSAACRASMSSITLQPRSGR